MSILSNYNVAPCLLLKLRFEYEDGSSKTVEVKEGQIVNRLTYVSNGEKKTVTGMVRLMNFISKQGITNKDSCVHDDVSSFSNYVTVTSLNIDCSNQYDCRFVQVPVKYITDIESVEDASVEA
jgi:hypothetical protein